MNTKHQKIESGIFILPMGECFFWKKNTTMLSCNYSSPLVGKEV